MKEIIAENYLCFLALIEMILEDLIGETYINQFYLAEYFGITVPHGCKTKIKNICYSDIDRELGVHLDENKLNFFFEETGIPLRASYIYVNPFVENDIDNYQCNNLRENSYVVYTYSYGGLYGIPDLYEIGHVALLDDVIGENCIRIYDPGPKHYGYKEINRHVLYEAIRIIKGGIYVFKKDAERM